MRKEVAPSDSKKFLRTPEERRNLLANRFLSDSSGQPRAVYWFVCVGDSRVVSPALSRSLPLAAFFHLSLRCTLSWGLLPLLHGFVEPFLTIKLISPTVNNHCLSIYPSVDNSAGRTFQSPTHTSAFVRTCCLVSKFVRFSLCVLPLLIISSSILTSGPLPMLST